MGHDEHRSRQNAILGEVLKILSNDARVFGILATGSYARGENDAFSDLDIDCYLRDEARAGRQELYDHVGAIAPLLCRLWLYDVNALYLFENGVRLDLDFHRPGDTQENLRERSSTAILYDPDGFLANHLYWADRLGANRSWSPPGDATSMDWFFWMFRQIICWTKRGAQGGYRAFDKLSNAADSLAQIRANLIEMYLWSLDAPYYLARADSECAQRMAKTFPHLTPEELIACTRLLLDEFERIGPACCHKAGVPYPAHKVEVMRELMAEFVQLD